MPPVLRKAALTAHVTSSVGWLGAVTAFLVLAITAVATTNDETTRALNTALETLAWLVLLPLAFASLLTGIVQSLGTSWGLFRHYWVLVKFVITIFATAVLLLYTGTLEYLADGAKGAAGPYGGSGAIRSFSPVLHSGAALVVLLVAAVLSVFKPRGVTAYGWRKKHEQESPSSRQSEARSPIEQP